MEYLLMIYEAEDIWESKSEDEKREVMQQHGLLNERLQADGVTYIGNPLMPTATALSLRKQGGKVETTDGPFAETKEQLAGFYMVDVESLEAALEYAAMIPTAGGGIEVRPVADHGGLAE